MRLLLGIALLAAGCREYDSIEILQPKVQEDFQCSDVVYDETYSNGCSSKSGCHDEWRATGCHQTGRYVCTAQDRWAWKCVAQSHTVASSSLAVNGAPFVPDGVDMCRSGVREGRSFYGVDLGTPNGPALRIVRNADLTFEAVVTSNGGNSPPLKDCVTAHFADDMLAGLRGDATLDCSSGRWTVKGSVVFQGCE